MKTIVYKDALLPVFSQEEYQSLNLRVVKNFVEGNPKKFLDGSKVRKALGVTREDFIVLDLEDGTMEHKKFYPNNYKYIAYGGFKL